MPSHKPANHPARVEYYFFEKISGAVRFKVEAGVDGSLPLDRAASILALHCLMRGHVPADYRVMVCASAELSREVASKAVELLRAGQGISMPVELSRREQEVLQGILQNLANKEIADRLCISERTVKYHVSSLLTKFHVQSRVCLMREAMGMFLPREEVAVASPAEPAQAIREAPWLPPAAPNGNRDIRTPRGVRRLLPA